MIFYTFFKKNSNPNNHLYEFRINNQFGTRLTGQQCSQKWRNLVRDYNVSKKNKNKFIRIEYIFSDTPMVFDI